MRQSTLHSLNERLKLLANAGRNIVVGWRYERDMVWLCAAPMAQVLAEAPEHPRILRGGRHLGARTFQQICAALNTAPTKIRLDRPVGEFGSSIHPDEIDRLVRCYGAYETAHRGAGLFDIVGFTKLMPLEQMAQLNILESTLNLVQARMQSCRLPVDFARSTTGDGFYIWNRHKGVLADICTYVLLILTLAEIKYMREVKQARFMPILRAGYHIGPHYTYHQIVGDNTTGHEHIVGELTIKLARMMEKALPDQILVSDFVRPTETGPIGAITFMMKSAEIKRRLTAIRIGHVVPTEIRSYLTGSTIAGRDFSVHRYIITDKHGHEYAVFNAKSTIHYNDRECIFLGLRSTDLAKFPAKIEIIDLGQALGDTIWAAA